VNRMPSTDDGRLALLERSVRRTRWAVATLSLVFLALLGVQLTRRPPAPLEEVRTRRLVVVDDAGRTRVVIAQDPMESQRRSRSAGLAVFDSTGTERGGFSTLDDGSVIFGMDAPQGVGNPMRERLSLAVGADGSSDVMLLDNLTRAVAKLQSDGNGGGVQVFKWDMEGKKIFVRTVVYDGDRHETVPMN
jgi:hypothetical protein